MIAEAVVFFDPKLAENFERRRLRAGHTASKMRFLSAQLLALLEGDHWLSLAEKANRCAQRLSDGASGLGYTLNWPTEANAVFLELNEAQASHLTQNGVLFHPWSKDKANKSVYRFVTSYLTEYDSVDRVIALLAEKA